MHRLHERDAVDHTNDAFCDRSGCAQTTTTTKYRGRYRPARKVPDVRNLYTIVFQMLVVNSDVTKVYPGDSDFD